MPPFPLTRVAGNVIVKNVIIFEVGMLNINIPLVWLYCNFENCLFSYMITFFLFNCARELRDLCDLFSLT